MKRSLKIGKRAVSLWLIVALSLGLVTGIILASSPWKTVVIPIEVKEPLEIISYPLNFTFYPGETEEFNITINNKASRNYTVVLDLSLEDQSYLESYVTFSDIHYLVRPGLQNLTAWLRIGADAPSLSGLLTIEVRRITEEVPLTLSRASSGRIAYDTFSASDGTATDMPWTIVSGDWTVEEGKFKSVSTTDCLAYLTAIEVTDSVWEAKVQPMQLTNEGPEVIFKAFSGDEIVLTVIFDYFNLAQQLRAIIYPETGPPSTFETYSFTMNEGAWYTVRVITSGSNMRLYVNDELIFDFVDANVGEAPPRRIEHSGYYGGEWGYWDDVKIWKSNNITISNLQEGQKVDLYDSADVLKATSTVETGKTEAELNVFGLTFPFEGYFKIYASDGTLLFTSQLYNDIWGGDIYAVIPS